MRKGFAVIGGVWFGLLVAMLPAVPVAAFLGLPSDKMWIVLLPGLALAVIMVPTLPVIGGVLMYLIL